MIVFSIIILLFILGNFKYALTGRSWSIEGDSFDRIAAFAFSEFLIEAICFVIYMGFYYEHFKN